MTHVSIGKSLYSISDAFYYCNSIASVHYNCTHVGKCEINKTTVKEITLGDNVKSVPTFSSTGWYSAQPDGLLYLDNWLIGYKGSEPAGEVVIAEGTTHISGESLYYNNSITSVYIPKSVKYIGEHFLRFCTGLTSLNVDIDNSVYDSRENCNAIIETYTNTIIKACANTTIPNTVNSIGTVSFEGLELVEIEIPDNVTDIAESAFRNCNNLRAVVIGNGVTTIGDYAFNGCSALESLKLGNKLETIGTGAFQSCSRLADVELPNSLLRIKQNAFYGTKWYNDQTEYPYILDGWVLYDNNRYPTTTGIRGIADRVYTNRDDYYIDLKFPNTVVAIGEYAFSSSGVHSVLLPNSILYIGAGAFYGTDLSSVSLPNSITSILSATFHSCRNLVEVVIPGSINKIESGAFSLSSSINKLYVLSKDAPFVEENGIAVFDTKLYSKATLYVPIGSKFLYQTSPVWKNFENIVEIETEYNISYVVDGDVVASDILTIGEIITPPANIPQKEGYYFSWSNSPSTMPAKDVVFEGTYSAKSYRVTYVIDSMEYKTQTVAYGAEIPTIKTPIKEGYTFSGWSEIPSTMPAEDITISGTFTANNYLVKYIVDGEVWQTDSVTYGTEIVLVDEPTKEGHTFSGWSEIPSTMPAEDITISGTFTANDYVVTYIVDGEVWQTDSVAYGTEIDLIDEPTKEGHTFSGWSEAPTIMPAEDIAISGSFTVNSYTVTFTIDGEVYKSMTVEYGTEIPTVETPVKEGHAFSGWSEIPSTMPAEDITVSGTFTANDYAVTYIVDGEVYKTDSVTYGTEIILIDEPTKEGHTFSGWSEIPSIMPAEDITVSGTFTANDYAVTYIVDGEVYKTDSVTYGTEIILIDEPTKEGHTFSGWSEIPSTMPAEDIVISGSFTVNSYTVTYVVDGVEYQTQTVAYGTEIPTIETPIKEGHTFSGWSEIPSTMPAEDITISGTFTANDYVVTYIVDGEVWQTDSVTYGTEIVLIDEPTKEGHTFSGWSEAPSTMPAESITISGYFTVNSYSVIFAIDGKIYESMTVEFGAEIPTVETPVKEGHTFSGWSEIPSTMPAEDIVINGSFIVNRYTVTFVVDGEVYKSAEIEYGAEIPIIEAPSKNGRKFSGWSEIPSTMPAENVIVEGKFCYTIIFMVDGKYYHSSEIYYGNDIKAPLEVPQKVGHTFVDWGDLPETMPARDMTIHAVFSVNEYQLIFIIDGEVYETLYIEYGSKIEYPQIEGYVITWETEDLPETMPAENLIIIGTSTLDTAIKGIHEVHSDYIIYTLDGHRVLDIENLRSGFYIINGKKVFVK